MFNFKLIFSKKKKAKKFLSFVLSLTMVFSMISVLNLSAMAAGSFESGLGTSANPYQISTPEQLDRVRENLSASYILIQDIDLTTYLASDGAGYAQWGDSGWKPIGDYTNKFTGNFNGADHTINGIWINRIAESYVGLFGCTNGTIENLGINIDHDKRIKGKYDVGGLVGEQVWGSITNCYATGSVSGSVGGVGGLVGGQNEGTITNCYATCNVSGSGDNIGGLVGSAFSSIIMNSYATGRVSGSSCVGGLVGKKYRGIVLGNNIITNSYATGSVEGLDSVGSLVGYQAGGSITYSYATGSVLGSEFVGGLVGYLDYGSIENCFFNTQTTGLTNAIGNDANKVINVNRLTTAQMVDSSVLTGDMVDFGADWSKRTSDTEYYYYPELTVFANNGTPAQQEASKISARVTRVLPTITDITAPSVTTGQSLTLTTPTITSPIETITSQGWQISANGIDTWFVYTGTALNAYYSHYYLRYYATSDMDTIYSNKVQITVNKLDLTIGENPTASNVWQGSVLSTSTLTGGTVNVSLGSFTWTNPNAVVNATGSFSVIFTPNDSNYNTATVKIAVTAIDKSALTSLISSSTLVKSGAVVGEGNGEYLQQAVDTFENAITAAETMANGIAPANQITVNDAVSTLQTAIRTFNASLVIVNYVSLNDLIGICNGVHANAFEGDGNTQYHAGSKTVFKLAINTATTVANNNRATQAQVDNAKSALQSALNTFNAQVIKNPSDNPKTSNNTNSPSLMAIMFASLCTLIITTHRRKSRNF